MLSKEQYRNYLDREEQRQKFEKEKMTTVNKVVSSRETWSVDDNDNKPKYRTDCAWFDECSFCFKCSNFDTKYEKCRNCELVGTNGVCFKDKIHTEKAKSMLIKQSVINLDKKGAED